MIRFRRIAAVVAIFVLPVALSAERVLMLNGTVLEGTILQQSRTAVQLRTTDGQVLLLDKSTIRKIEYGPTADQLKQLDDARKADEARRLEEARKAEEQKRLDDKRKADEAKAAEDARRAEEARREAERRAVLPPVSVPAGWWLEPSLALAGGSTRSLAQQGYGRRLALEETISPFVQDETGTGSRRVITGDKDNWTFEKTSVLGAGLFGGRGRWLGNLAYEQLSTRPSFGYVAFGTQIAILGGGAEKLTGRTAMLEVGYRVVDRASWSLDVLGGVRSYREETGLGALRFRGDPVLLPESLVSIQLTGSGSGPQGTLRWTRAIPSTRWTFVLAGRVFRMKVIASLDETSLATDNTGSTQHIHAEDGYTLVGMSLSLQAAYRLARQTDVFLGMEGVGTRSSLLEARDLWMYNPSKPMPAGDLLMMKVVSGSIAPVTRSGPTFAGLSFGVRRRFEL